MKRAYYEKLERLLWRYSMQHGGPGNYVIACDKVSKIFTTIYIENHTVLGPTFATHEDAKNACEEILIPMLEKDNKSFEKIVM